MDKIKVVNKYCRWVHARVRSAENCSSLEIFNASMTDLQAIAQIYNYKSCDYAIINHARYYFKYNLKSTIKFMCNYNSWKPVTLELFQEGSSYFVEHLSMAASEKIVLHNPLEARTKY